MNVLNNASGKQVAAGREARRQRASIKASLVASPRITPMAAFLDHKHMKALSGARHICHVAAVETAEAEAEAPAVEAAPENPTDTTSYANAVMLQGFAWESSDQQGWFKHLKDRIGDMKAAGITHVWLPPPSASVAKQGYMPSQLYDLNSHYGNEEDLRNLVKALNEADIAPICDIVINHRCADDQEHGVYNKFRDDVDHGNKRIDWGKWAITGNDPKFQGTGNPDTGADFDGAPDLDHKNPELRAALKEWLGWLKDDIGFKGWRFDFAKGYGAEFVKEYCEATTAGALNVGEYWTDMAWGDGGLQYNQDGARQTIVDWVNKTGKLSLAFDFPTKGILQESVKLCQYGRLRDAQGKASGGIGWLPSRMVTFISNHDTDSTQGHWPFPTYHIELGYAYILTHPGIPCLFWDHVMRDGTRDKIIKMVEMRKRNGINNRSSLEILAADDDMYVARIDGKVMIKMGPKGDMGNLTPRTEDGWHTVCNGRDFAVWEKK